MSEVAFRFEPTCVKSRDFYQLVQNAARNEDCVLQTPVGFLREYASEVLLRFKSTEHKHVKHGTCKEVVEIVSIALESLIPNVADENRMRITLESIFPLIDEIATEIFRDISSLQDSDSVFLTSTKSTLQISVIYLKSLNDCLKHICHSPFMRAVNEPLAQIVFPYMLAMYSHFQERQNTYRDFKAEFQDLISELYRLSFDVVCNAVAVISRTTQNSRRTLQIFCDGLHHIAEKAVLLSAKTFTKTYSSLITLLENNFAVLSDVDVSAYVHFLATQARYFLNKTREVDPSMQKVMYKLAGFCVKNLDAICGLFADRFTSQTYQVIVELVADIQKFSPSLKPSLSGTESSDLNQCCMLAELLGERLLQHDGFCNALVSLTLSSNEFSACVLWANFLNIMTPYKEPKWLERMLFYYEQCYVQCATPYLMKGVVWGGRPSNFEPFPQVMTAKVCGYIGTLTPADVPSVVIILLNQLKSPNVFASMLASDALCFMARYGSGQFCLQLVLAVVELLPLPLNSGTVCQRLVWLFGRLCTFLGKSSWKLLLNASRPSQERVLWALLPLTRFPVEAMEQIRERAVRETSEDSSNAILARWILLNLMNKKSISSEVTTLVEGLVVPETGLRTLGASSKKDMCSLLLVSVFRGLAANLSEFQELFRYNEELNIRRKLTESGKLLRPVVIPVLVELLLKLNSNSTHVEYNYPDLVCLLGNIGNDPVVKQSLLTMESQSWRAFQAWEIRERDVRKNEKGVQILETPRSQLTTQQYLELQTERMRRAGERIEYIDKTCVSNANAATEVDADEQDLQSVVNTLLSCAQKLNSFHSRKVPLDIQCKLGEVSETLKRFVSNSS